MKKILTILSFLFCFTSCQMNGTYENEESLKIEAQGVADNFYREIQKKHFNDAGNDFSDKFFEVTSREELNKIFSKTYDVAGDYKSKTLSDWKTKRTVGSKPISEYLLVYNVTYSKYSAIETIRLLKEGSSVKIIGYNINSEAFLK